MNETVINKIAEQLGIAADKAAQLLGQIIPQYARMQAFDYFPKVLIFLIAALFFFLVGYFLHRSLKTRVISDDMDFYNKRDVTEEIHTLQVLSLICIVFGLLCLGMAISDACSAISWLYFPEAHVFQMVLNKF